MSDATVSTSEVLNHTIGRAVNDDLEKVVGVMFKDEDEDDEGRAVGPVWLIVGGTPPDPNTNPYGVGGENVPYHLPDQLEWFTVSFAEALAGELSVPLVRA